MFLWNPAESDFVRHIVIDARPIVYWPWTVVRTSQRGEKRKRQTGDRDRECAREDDRALPIDSDGIIHILRAERPGGLFVARAVRTRNKGYRKLVYSLMAADRIIRYIRPGFRLANVSFNFILPRCNEGRQNSRPRYSSSASSCNLMHREDTTWLAQFWQDAW